MLEKDIVSLPHWSFGFSSISMRRNPKSGTWTKNRGSLHAGSRLPRSSSSFFLHASTSSSSPFNPHLYSKLAPRPPPTIPAKKTYLRNSLFGTAQIYIVSSAGDCSRDSRTGPGLAQRSFDACTCDRTICRPFSQGWGEWWVVRMGKSSWIGSLDPTMSGEYDVMIDVEVGG